jgi:hypothetical protein
MKGASGSIPRKNPRVEFPPAFALIADSFAHDKNMSKERNCRVSRRNLSIGPWGKKMKNGGARRKCGRMIDARNEDELKSEADLSGRLSCEGFSTNFLARPNTGDRGGFTTPTPMGMQEIAIRPVIKRRGEKDDDKGKKEITIIIGN